MLFPQRTITSLSLILSLFFPLSVYAQEFIKSNEALSYKSDQQIYKFDNSNLPWRMVSPLEGELVGDAISIGTNIFQVSKIDSKYYLYNIERAIKPQLISQFKATDLIEITKQEELIIVQVNFNNSKKIYRINSAVEVREIAQIPIEQTAIFFDETRNILVTKDETKVYLNNVGQDCPQAVNIVIKLPITICQNNTIKIYENRQFKNIEYVSNYKYSDNLLWVDLLNKNKLIISKDAIIELTINSDQQINQNNIDIIGNRIFVKSNGYWELDFKNNKLISISQAPAEVMAVGNDVILISQEKYLFSRKTGEYSAFKVLTNFNRANYFGKMIVLFQHDGSTIQALNPDTLEVSASTGSWAKSSKIKSISSFGGLYFLSLLNSSLKPNLYKSENLLSWTRITLPTKITNSLPIAQIRELEAGQLVEFWGTVTTVPGEISSEINYLQDESGGIQLFLNSDNGPPIDIRNNLVQVYGEISSSVVKRVILDSREGLRILGSSTIKPIKLSLAEAINRPGVLSNIEAEVKSTDEKFMTLYSEIKLNFAKLKNKYSGGDKINLNVISDYNSYTKKYELWKIGEAEKIIKPPKPSVTATTTQKQIENEVKKTKATTPTPKQITTVTTVTKISRTPNPNNEPQQLTIIGSATTNEKENYFYALFGFLIGLLSVSSKLNLSKGPQIS
ncbi:hypothetical protein HY844_01935 [Candidatus Berkelbacteria bacterium]|nr:hypothetical protein [Candidatus Berkelbacteria bacterium]